MKNSKQKTELHLLQKLALIMTMFYQLLLSMKLMVEMGIFVF